MVTGEYLMFDFSFCVSLFSRLNIYMCVCIVYTKPISISCYFMCLLKTYQSTLISIKKKINYKDNKNDIFIFIGGDSYVTFCSCFHFENVWFACLCCLCHGFPIYHFG